MKLTSEDNVEAFLITFEQVAQCKQWEEERGQISFYPALKAEILIRCGLSPVNAAFNSWSYEPCANSHSQIDTLFWIARRWLQPERHTAMETVERVVMDHFL